MDDLVQREELPTSRADLWVMLEPVEARSVQPSSMYVAAGLAVMAGAAGVAGSLGASPQKSLACAGLACLCMTVPGIALIRRNRAVQ